MASTPSDTGLTPERAARELARRIAALPAPDATPLALPGDAWERRLLVALADHLPRQRWVAEVVETRLRGDPRLIASHGSLGHPEAIEQAGGVPGLPDWSYFFHGCGCCLTHRDGTAIDVDFDEHGADGIDPYFYQRYLESLGAPAGVEALLRRPEPYDEAWMADLEGLRRIGLIEGEHRRRLTPLGLRWAEAIGPALREMAGAEPQRKRLLAIVLADYSLAAQAGEAPADAALVALERQAADERADRLGRGVTERRDRHCLTALAELGPTRARDVAGRVLEEEPLDALTSTAVKLVESWADPAYHAALLRLAWRSSLANDAPGPFLRTRALELVLGAYRADTLPPDLRALALAALREDARSSEGGAGLLLFLLEPTDGVLRLARALRHEVPMARCEAAAYLALIGTAEAAAALRAASTPEAAATLALLRGEEPEPPPEPAYEVIEWRGRPRKVYRFDDLMSADLPGWVREAVDRARERYGPLLERWWAS